MVAQKSGFRRRCRGPINVRHMRAAGALAGSVGDFHVTSLLQEFGIPRTVQAVIAARIDLLPEDGRSLLQLAAIWGSGATVEELRALSEPAPSQWGDSLNRLERDAFLRVAFDADGAERILFAHDLIQEVAYAGL